FRRRRAGRAARTGRAGSQVGAATDPSARSQDRRLLLAGEAGCAPPQALEERVAIGRCRYVAVFGGAFRQIRGGDTFRRRGGGGGGAGRGGVAGGWAARSAVAAEGWAARSAVASCPCR